MSFYLNYEELKRALFSRFFANPRRFYLNYEYLKLPKWKIGISGGQFRQMLTEKKF